ncbi:hypothetical protein NK8_72200 (plasmid) [Caballeronia sp. NK8]|nr:hypothetical protein NK8_72200 [Caballeronia sp. NK8]
MTDLAELTTFGRLKIDTTEAKGMLNEATGKVQEATGSGAGDAMSQIKGSVGQ